MRGRSPCIQQSAIGDRAVCAHTSDGGPGRVRRRTARASLRERRHGYHPPPIPTEVSKAVAQACAVSSPTLDRIKHADVLVWAIGVSPPFSFRLPNGDWAGIEAQNAAELATVLGVDFDI